VQALGALGLSAAACLANPSTYKVFAAGFGPIVDPLLRLFGRGSGLMTTDQLGFFDRESQAFLNRTSGPTAASDLVALYLVAVLLVLVSFALNWKRFSPARFLLFAAMAVMWAGGIALNPVFAVVFAVVLTLNGQEWYHDTVGTQGRLGLGWKAFSDGGRAATILATYAFIAMAVTGWTAGPGTPSLGLGYQRSSFAFEAMEFLRDSQLSGNVANLSVSLGDELLWKDRIHKPFIDQRPGVYPPEIRQDLETLKGALRRDEPKAWGEIFDKYKVGDREITTVVLSPNQDFSIYQALSRSPFWTLLHDSGNAVVFGRTDRETVDLARIKELRLEPDAAVYGRNGPIEGPERPPTELGLMDTLLPSRANSDPDPHYFSGSRWFLTAGEQAATIDPARAILAIREARLALRNNPDDTAAFRLLQTAYRSLVQAEATILGQGAAPDQPAPTAYLNFRYRQRVAALAFAVMTAPPPQNANQRFELAELNLQLADMYQTNGVFDLERDRLEAVRKLVSPGDVEGPARARLEAARQRLEQLDEQIELFRSQLAEFTTTNNATPVQRADLAAQNGFLGMAIEEYLAAEGAGVNLAQLRWILLDLYCTIGRPDKAYDLLEGTTANDESLGADGPNPAQRAARAAYRQGTVNVLLGYYSLGTPLWQNYAIPPLRIASLTQSLNAARDLLRGQPVPATRGVLEVGGTPESPGLVETQAQWQAELGLVLLEAGQPLDTPGVAGQPANPGAATSFRTALELQPRHPLRPLLVYYLEKLGQTAPPLPDAAEGTPEPAAAPAAEPAAGEPATP
jgi:hypothetical protein